MRYAVVTSVRRASASGQSQTALPVFFIDGDTSGCASAEAAARVAVDVVRGGSRVAAFGITHNGGDGRYVSASAVLDDRTALSLAVSARD
jgi:hypothetical protein